MMKALVYYITLPFLFLLSLLPLPILYLVSDVAFLLLYHVIRYRRKVVTTNLHTSFPHKSKQEIAHIRRRFYRYLCDLILETVKTLTINASTIRKRCYMTPQSLALFNRYHEQKKSIIIVLGHWGNWEWGGSSFSLQCPQPLYVLYHPLSHPYFNRLLFHMRTRLGTRLIAMNDTLRQMLNNKQQVTATAFIADQTPPPDGAYWTTFLHQETPVFWGTEKIARKLNYPVVYVGIKRIKRGHYEIHGETLVENPTLTKEGELSELHTKRLEQDILLQPETWLWSHRRWKHKRRK